MDQINTASGDTVPLCAVCARHLKGEGMESDVIEPWQCSMCFGILDPRFIENVAAQVKSTFDSDPYDCTNFMLVLQFPVGVTLRETIVDVVNKSKFSNGTLSSVPFKLRVIQSYIRQIEKVTQLRPALNSDLTLTISLVNDEFNASDLAFLSTRFPSDFRISKKRNHFGADVPVNAVYNKSRVGDVLSRLTPDNTKSFNMKSPSTSCTFSVLFKRESIFVASRYCKFSRNLPQSPWTASENIPIVPGNSVSEKVASALRNESKCESTRFIASGREDIDVRMLGTGRPFALQLTNPHLTASFCGDRERECLERIEKQINCGKDVRLGAPLKKISIKQLDPLKRAQDEKHKSYTAYCYSTEPLDDHLLDALSNVTPLQVVQKTPVRVLKRRPLLDRTRTIHTMRALKLDQFHFLIRLETQAGTYIKEFVHGDFGRTRPSLADLLKMDRGEVDILELDVEHVHMQWPAEDTA